LPPKPWKQYIAAVLLDEVLSFCSAVRPAL
jgi:hypothetical protein